MTHKFAATPLLAVALMLGTPADAAGPKASAGAEKPRTAIEPDGCTMAYHASLARIAAEDLPRLRVAAAAPAGPQGAPAEALPQADASLPGQPLFVPPSRQRNGAEISALTAAVALARSRGRSTSVASSGSDTERTWIAARLREDLGDYLTQAPTPFLCNGVPAWLDTMRRFAGRLGPAGDRRPEWIATQRLGAERSVKAAEIAIAKARANAAQTVAASDLRLGADLSRSEAPPAPPQPSLGDEAGLLATIDRLVGEARSAGLVAEPAVPQVTGATVPPPPAPSRPVLRKLVETRPLVMSARPLIHDRTARLKLLAAFADLEALDYLMHAAAAVPDPVASAIGQTLDGIGEAHKTDCTCSR